MKQVFSKSFSDAYAIVRLLNKRGFYKIEDLKQGYMVMSCQQAGGMWNNLSDDSKQRVYADSVMFNKELDGQCVHYFVDNKHLKSFLKETEIKDFSFYKQMLYDEWKDTDMRGDYYRFCFCLHFLDEEESPRYLITFNAENKSAMEVIRLVDSDKVYDQLPIFDNKMARIACEYNEDLRIGINFLYYIKAFPEVVKDGIPKGYKTENMRGKRHTVKLCDKICIDTKSVTPHFRRGHFRYLGSEFYTKKRGKTIFVDSTVVNSKNNKVVEK